MTALEDCMVNHHHPRVKKCSPLLKSSLKVYLHPAGICYLYEFRLTLLCLRQKPCPVQQVGRLSWGHPALEVKVAMASSTPSPFPAAQCYCGDSEPAALFIWRDSWVGVPGTPLAGAPAASFVRTVATSGDRSRAVYPSKNMGWSPHMVVPHSWSVPMTLEAKHLLAGPLQPSSSLPPPHPESRSSSRDSDQETLKGKCNCEMLSWGKPARWASSLPFLKRY